MNKNKVFSVKIGKRIQKARENAGLTCEQLAARIGVDEKKLSAIEKGTGRLYADTLREICIALSISSDVLFEDFL